jgi:hypothetical protein
MLIQILDTIVGTPSETKFDEIVLKGALRENLESARKERGN